jgi:hypothetical protein
MLCRQKRRQLTAQHACKNCSDGKTEMLTSVGRSTSSGATLPMLKVLKLLGNIGASEDQH